MKVYVAIDVMYLFLIQDLFYIIYLGNLRYGGSNIFILCCIVTYVYLSL